MRILTVSAHYPPNFVSGGTLQPQRISRGLRARGHDVSVYAGWIGDRPPLESWADTDDTGMAVRWIDSSPWIGWADERNWLNPAVTDHFAAHIDALKPDVVHFHALQSLGAGLLPAAKAAGAKVVVTMHDFWWLCSRQFLVSPDLVPCSLVVDAGTCPCEVDVAWRCHRAASLATLLGSADLVLAPSASATRVLAANGVAPGRLHVDENGLPPDVIEALVSPHRADRVGRDSAHTADPGDLGDVPVRLLYAGGPNVMKGVSVLIEAARRLTDVPGWRVSGYGVQEYLDKSGETVAGLAIDVLDPFDPADLGAVLAAHDVLVLPSVMRETHSLLTREALAAGLPVVCTDTLGPEEVITHGANGLVVPAADAGALAGAIERLATNPDLLADLRLGAAEPVAARSIDEQVAGLDERFAELLAAPTPGPAVLVDGPEQTDQVGRVLFVVGIEGAPLRYRARLPAEALAGVGVTSDVRHYRDPELLALGGRADVVVFYRVPATVQVLALIDALHGAGVPCAFDVDDLIFDPAIADEIPALRLLDPDDAALWLQGVQRYRTTLEACDAYIGSTAMLVDHAATLTGLPAHRFDNGVGLALARRCDDELRRERRPGPLRIGYLSGTTTHDEDWFHVEPAVVEVLDRHPTVELWLGGHLPDSATLTRFGSRVVRLPFVPWLDLPAVLRDLDINLSPLAPGSRFNEAKSAIKWLEAALCATPTVASPTTPFREAITDGDTGLLAGDHEQWVDAVEQLLGDESSRRRIGSLARRRALLDWAPAIQGERYRTILTEVAAAGPHPPRSTPPGAPAWTPVALDEPPMPVTLERYPDGAPTPTPDRSSLAVEAAPHDVRSPGRALDRVIELARRGVASARTEGFGPTARKAGAKVRSRYGSRP
jgi:glycosyltransferase involved in cell wall biosynthesis